MINIGFLCKFAIRIRLIMKKSILMAMMLCGAMTASAQQDKDASAGEQSLFEKVTNIEKKQDNFHLLLNLNNSFDGLDNMPATSIDIAGIGVKFNDVVSMFLGKQCAAYGGFEYDTNPIEIYQYSDMLDNMSIFLTGATLQFQLRPDHQLQLQAVDSRRCPWCTA